MKNITKRILFILITVFTFYSCTPHKPADPKDALTAFLTTMKSHKSISYYIKYSFNNGFDTANAEAHCILIRNDKDSVFKGYVLFKEIEHYINGNIHGSNHFENYYDLDSIYDIDDSLKKITTYNPKNKNQKWGLEPTRICGAIINVFFLDATNLENDIKDTANKITLSDVRMDNEDYWKIRLNYPNFQNSMNLSNRWSDLWINTQNNSLKRISFHSTQGNIENNYQRDIDSIVFDKETPDDLKRMMKDKLASYSHNPLSAKVKIYVPPLSVSERPLSVGMNAPEFSGTDFATGKTISLPGNYRGKPVLLDFWGMNCQPCIQAMPIIKKINNEFSKKGLVILGINCGDNKAKLSDFIKIHKIAYPTILTDMPTLGMYKVRGIPSFYLINEKGEVAFAQVGYSENIDSVLEVEIKKTLRR